MHFDYHVPIVLTVQWDKYIEQYIFKGLSADFKQDLIWGWKFQCEDANGDLFEVLLKWAEFKFPECRGFEDS